MVELVWWHWLAFGLLLMGLELLLPSFTIFWFGLGAGCVGLVLVVWPDLPVSGQLLLWAGTSVFWTVLWFRWWRPRSADRTKAGTAKDAIIGELGIIVRPVSPPLGKGQIRFAVPLLGDEEWPCIAAEPLTVGDEAVVLDIEGHVLRVQRRN